MGLWNFVRQTVFGRASEIIKMQFKEMILIIEPQSSATMFAEYGSETTVSGFAGTVWIQVEDQELGHQVKHGESFKIPGYGKIVFWAATQNVPCKVHVSYMPPPQLIH